MSQIGTCARKQRTLYIIFMVVMGVCLMVAGINAIQNDRCGGQQIEGFNNLTQRDVGMYMAMGEAVSTVLGVGLFLAQKARRQIERSIEQGQWA